MADGHNVVIVQSDYYTKEKDPPFSKDNYKPKCHRLMIVLLIIGLLAIVAIGIWIGVTKAQESAGNKSTKPDGKKSEPKAEPESWTSPEPAGKSEPKAEAESWSSPEPEGKSEPKAEAESWTSPEPEGKSETMSKAEPESWSTTASASGK